MTTAFSPGRAQDSSASPLPSFESLDKNGDGRISLSEAAENDALFVAFKELDKDRDGMLTPEEFAAYKGS
jgi:Ca2+-binding EF-hand superfamily protein